MKLLYKITLIIAFAFVSLLNAQKSDKKYVEEFKTNDYVLINVETRHTDIQIENWNKNVVLIEAYIVVEGATADKAEDIINNWKFKAIGNKNEIEITSNSHGVWLDKIKFSNGDELNFQKHALNFDFPEISIENLGILDSFEIATPDALHFPELLVMPEMDDFDIEIKAPPFDFEEYKKDENYMKKWQEEMMKNIEMQSSQWKELAAKRKENVAMLKEELKAAQEERKKYLEERNERLIQMEKERALRIKENAKLRKEVYEKRRQELDKNRELVRNILANRDKIKVKRVIKIKAPKEAKFKMNVSYGSVSFPN
ncbi:MAG: hypothetical protein KJO83_06480 [Bacteroidia bacterium]|nr:hypothetical protein [Bacteroidia bacterium]